MVASSHASDSGGPFAPTSDSLGGLPGLRSVASKCQYSPRVSLMRPRIEVPSTRSVGATDKGALKDALINRRVSLAVGKRWPTAPLSHFESVGAAVADCADSWAGAASESDVAAVPRRNSRRVGIGNSWISGTNTSHLLSFLEAGPRGPLRVLVVRKRERSPRT